MTSNPSSPRHPVPEELAGLFWDCNLRTLDIHRHRVQILQRVLEQRPPPALHWALETYGEQVVRDFLRGQGAELLSGEALAFWYRHYDLGEPPRPEKP